MPAAAAGRQSCRCAAFTLVELMAGVLIICILMGTLIAVAKYVNRQLGVTRAKTQLAALQMALDAYKADVGYYPASTWVRYSGYGLAELSNSACLYRALTRSKRYYNGRQVDIGATGSLTYFLDPWGTAWNYYRPALPQPTNLIVSNVPGTWMTIPQGYQSYAWGGQHNQTTYDLWSYGPDKITTVPGTIAGGYMWASSVTDIGRDTDDIVNWTR